MGPHAFLLTLYLALALVIARQHIRDGATSSYAITVAALWPILAGLLFVVLAHNAVRGLRRMWCRRC